LLKDLNTTYEERTGNLKKVIIGILAVLLLLFIIFMLIPDDEAEVEEQEVSESIQYTQEENTNPYGDLSAAIEAIPMGTDAKSATIMIYMNGSDLESNAGEASSDITEMLESGIGKKVNVIIQTMGTKEWMDYGISSDTAQTYKIENGNLKIVRDNLGQLDSTSPDTLSEFIRYCKNSYPADRYELIFWNHGGGPVYGFGYDEWQDEESSLTISEIAKALSENRDIHFDIIGMDCCIMASIETCYAFSPYCKYALLSEDFESGLGWTYTNWMRLFEENPGISSPLLGKYIVDDIIKENDTSEYGDSACVSLFNVATSKDLFEAWKAYAYKNEKALLDKNYSKEHTAKGRSFWDLWASDQSDVTISDYYISDILAILENVDNSSPEAKKLTSALKAAVVYYGHTVDKNELTGLAVSLPYGDEYFYERLKEVYKGIGLDNEYIEWLGAFVDSEGYSDYFDFGSFMSNWAGWGAYEALFGCNISGGSCEYSYDYDSANYADDYYYEEGEYDDWLYDSEEDIWYLYEDDILYLYDDESDTLFYYDEPEDKIYYYDEDKDDWLEAE